MLFIVSIIAAVVAFSVYVNAKKKGNKAESAFATIGFFVAGLIAFMQCWTIIPPGRSE